MPLASKAVTDAGLSLPTAVQIREVGPRDGLQSEVPIDPGLRGDLASALIGAGCHRIEAASFVSERAVPAMAGAAAVIERIGTLANRSELTVTALVPNLRGAEYALAAPGGVDELTVTVAASAVYNERNVRRTIEESVTEIGLVAAAAHADRRTPVDAVISCAFGSPYEGDIPPSDIAALAARLLDAGVDALTLADTTGMATPRVVAEVLEATRSLAPRVDPGLHLHDTRGTGLVNAYAAMQLGVTRFDTAIGGLGGSPFAHGAGGNLATEDFVALLDDLGIETGIDVAMLLGAAALASELLGRELPSKVSHAGPRLGGLASENP